MQVLEFRNFEVYDDFFDTSHQLQMCYGFLLRKWMIRFYNGFCDETVWVKSSPQLMACRSISNRRFGFGDGQEEFQ